MHVMHHSSEVSHASEISGLLIVRVHASKSFLVINKLAALSMAIGVICGVPRLVGLVALVLLVILIVLYFCPSLNLRWTI